jgi:hypothetical protein
VQRVFLDFKNSAFRHAASLSQGTAKAPFSSIHFNNIRYYPKGNMFSGLQTI